MWLSGLAGNGAPFPTGSAIPIRDREKRDPSVSMPMADLMMSSTGGRGIRPVRGPEWAGLVHGAGEFRGLYFAGFSRNFCRSQRTSEPDDGRCKAGNEIIVNAVSPGTFQAPRENDEDNLFGLSGITIP